MKLKNILLPIYSLGEELWNSISHGLGALFTLIAGPFLIVKAAFTGDPWKIVSVSIYVFSLLLLYTVSCIYHALKRNNGKKVFRILDHNMIFVLIAGTYTPYCLVSLREYTWFSGVPGLLGFIIFGIVWGAAALGITMNSIDIKKYAKLSMSCYIGVGWCIVLAFIPLFNVIELNGVLLLLFGGISYTIGAILYGIGKKHKYMHTVFHFFVLAGTILQFISIFLYVI